MKDELTQAIERIDRAAAQVLASGCSTEHEDNLADALRDVSCALSMLREKNLAVSERLGNYAFGGDI